MKDSAGREVRPRSKWNAEREVMEQRKCDGEEVVTRKYLKAGTLDCGGLWYHFATIFSLNFAPLLSQVTAVPDSDLTGPDFFSFCLVFLKFSNANSCLPGVCLI